MVLNLPANFNIWNTYGSLAVTLCCRTAFLAGGGRAAAGEGRDGGPDESGGPRGAAIPAAGGPAGGGERGPSGAGVVGAHSHNLLQKCIVIFVSFILDCS